MSEPSAALQELAQLASLENVYLHHLEARREVAPPHDEVEPPDFRLRVDVEDLPLAAGATVRRSRFHLRVTAVLDEGRILVEPVAEFHVPADRAELLELPTRIEFANEVAVMTLLPFAREAVADLSLRVFRSPLIMPTFQRGQIAFEVPSEDQQVHDTD